MANHSPVSLSDWQNILSKTFAPIESISTHLDRIDVTGADAAKLLQGQMTQDIAAVSSDKTCWSAICSPKGRVISVFAVIQTPDGYALVVPSNNTGELLETLKKYALFYKAEVKHTGNLCVCANTPDTEHYITLILAGNCLKLCLTEQAADHKHLMTALAIAAEVPLLEKETSEKFLAQSIGLDEINAISFKKGCYTGQEIIARLQFRGQSKYHLRTLVHPSNMVVKPGEVVLDNAKNVGHVVQNIIVSNGSEYLSISQVSVRKDAAEVLTIADQTCEPYQL